MNENVKNIFSFIKEALELKNKNIYVLDNYEIHLDFGKFYSQFKELIETPNYSALNINSDNIIFKLKYIKDDSKKEIPGVPDNLKEYISLNDNDIISLVDDLEEVLSNAGLLEEYRNFDNDIKEINRYNSLIDLYNSKYMQFYNVYKRITDYEEKIEIIYGQKLLIWKNNQNDNIQRYILEANLDISVDPINNIINFTINKEKFRGFVIDFLNLESYKIKDTITLYDFVKDFNEEKINDEIDFSEEAKKYINYVSIENEIWDRELQDGDTLKQTKTYLFNNSGIIVRNKNVKLWIEDLDKIIRMCNSTEFLSPILNMFEIDFANQEQVENLINDKTYDDTKEDEILFPLPANDEQYKIVDKVKSSNIVLVQGPPGTGKSHTIANLISHYISEGKKVIVTSEKAKALEVLRDKIPEKIRSLSLALLTSKGVDKELEFSIKTLLNNQKDDNELEIIKNIIQELNEKLKNNHMRKQDTIRKIIDLMSKDTVSHRAELNEILDFGNMNELTLKDIAIWLEKNKKYKIISTNDVENYSYTNPRDFFEKLDDICEDIKNKKFAISKEVPMIEYLKNNEIELYIQECIGYKNYQLHNPELISAIKQSCLTEDIIDELKIKIECLSYLYNFFEKEWIKSNISYDVFIKKIEEIKLLIEKNEEFITNTERELFDFSIKIENELEKESYQTMLKNILDLFNDNGNIRIWDKLKYNSYIKRLDGLLYNNRVISKDNITRKDISLIKNAIDYYILIDSINMKIKQLLEINFSVKFNINKNQFGKYKDRILEILNDFINFKKYAQEIDDNFNKAINTNLFAVSYMDSSEELINNIFEDLKYYITINSSVSKCNRIISEIRKFYKDYNLQNLDGLLMAIQTNQLEEYINNKNLLLHEINIINQYNNLKSAYSNLVQDKHDLIINYIYKFTFEEKQFLKDNIDKILKYHYIEKYYLSLEKKESELPKLYAERERLIKEEKNIISELVEIKGWFFQNKNMNYNISTSLSRWVNLKKTWRRNWEKC